MFNSYFDITRGSNPWGLFGMKGSAAAAFFATHGLRSLAKEEAWRPKKNRGVPGRSGMMKLWFFRHPKPTTKSINKNKQNNRISTSIPAFHLSFSDFHGDLHRFHGFHTLEIGFWHFRRPIPADLDWWYSTPLEYGFQGRTREKSSCEFPWWETFWWCQQFANLKPWRYFPSRNFVSFPS